MPFGKFGEICCAKRSSSSFLQAVQDRRTSDCRRARSEVILAATAAPVAQVDTGSQILKSWVARSSLAGGSEFFTLGRSLTAKVTAIHGRDLLLDDFAIR